MKYLNDVSYKDCIGKVFKSKSSGDIKILKYNDGNYFDIWRDDYYVVMNNNVDVSNTNMVLGG